MLVTKSVHITTRIAGQKFGASNIIELNKAYWVAE